MADNNEIRPAKLTYQRTNQPWKCGRIADGQPCPSGPTGRGECIHRECKPIRRLFSVRRHIQFAIVAAGIFIYVALLVSNYRQDAFAPGPLSLAHAQILQNSKDSEKCSACHSAGQLNSLAWFASPHPMTDSGKSQSQLCVECHIRDMPELSLNNPHDLAIDEIRNESQNFARRNSSAKKLIGTPRVDLTKHDLACSDCHQEHRGSAAELQAITSQRCQSCHQSRFASFTNGHPEFQNYPYGREQRIVFSHASHQADHFPKKNSAFECRNCHVDQMETGAVGNIMRSLSFERACASCHQQPLQNALSDGIVFFQIPSIDRRKLADAGVELGNWPDDSSQGFDGKIPPLMRLLLESDSSLREALELLPPDGDFAKLDSTRAETAEAVVKIAEGVRELLKEIAIDGQQAIYSRLKINQGLSSSTDPGSLLALGIPPDVFRRAYELWFVNDKKTVAIPEDNILAPVQLNAPRTPDSRQSLNSPDLLNQERSANSREREMPEVNDEEDLLAVSNDQQQDVDPLIPEDANSVASDGNTWPPKNLQRSQLLAGGWMIDENRKAITYIGVGHRDPWLTQWLPYVAAHTNRSSTGTTPGLPFAATLAVTDSLKNEVRTLPTHPAIPPESFMHPLQHGRCAECHRVDMTSPRTIPPDETQDLWRASRRPDTIRQITRFDHQPHLILGKLADCTACHHLSNPKAQHNATAKFSEVGNKSVPNGVAGHPTQNRGNSEFEPIKLANCSQCHRSDAAGDSCTQCHNYHVGQSGWVWDRQSKNYDFFRE